ncbi:hypothetical protein [Yoonia sediminilitoris]|uniref:Cache domain-containing protein n=1 Tax=Yoonia sediminilitoris TaxID=1286148 RepID=A0A2T6KQH8_9RHOB|nr:hypothetical protein [Yoonia sediminilitoris]PUB18817.1 hypothetical protein C8N45_101406 [Yoonia sediminilitoris]RCW98985.1 hypothetical protein DFP92_101406 [Yoonia sediminilitoris]
MRLATLGLLFLAGSGSLAHADEYHGALQNFLETNIRAWASNPVLVEAINEQNVRTADFDQAMIDQADLLWRAQVDIEGAENIEEVLINPAANFLREQVVASAGAITEVFIMDSHGMNVAASAVTSDYWQGDEAKFTQTYPMGPDAVHLGDVELDQSTQAVQSQVSIPMVDPDTSEVIGAMTVAIDLTYLAQ